MIAKKLPVAPLGRLVISRVRVVRHWNAPHQWGGERDSEQTYPCHACRSRPSSSITNRNYASAVARLKEQNAGEKPWQEETRGLKAGKTVGRPPAGSGPNGPPRSIRSAALATGPCRPERGSGWRTPRLSGQAASDGEVYRFVSSGAGQFRGQERTAGGISDTESANPCDQRASHPPGTGCRKSFLSKPLGRGPPTPHAFGSKRRRHPGRSGSVPAPAVPARPDPIDRLTSHRRLRLALGPAAASWPACTVRTARHFPRNHHRRTCHSTAISRHRDRKSFRENHLRNGFSRIRSRESRLS